MSVIDYWIFLLRSKDITSKSLLIAFSQYNIHILVMNEIQVFINGRSIDISVCFLRYFKLSKEPGDNFVLRMSNKTSKRFYKG